MAWTGIKHFLNSDFELIHLNIVQLPDTPRDLTNMKKERLIFIYFFYEKGKGPK